MKRMILVVGEGMLELSRVTAENDGWSLGHGGDTLNTAVHLARLGARVAFVTALGSDPFSLTLRTDWASEGLDLSLARTDPDRRPALYAITTDAQGERSFTYWRSDSAARRMFALGDNADVLAAGATAELLYFSMISLAILPPEGRETLFELCARVRSGGGRVAFDSNYRPALWESVEVARAAHLRAIAVTDIGLPTREDEHALIGLDDPAAIDRAWRDRGVGEVVVKLGADGCFAGGAIRPVPAPIAAIDTTGAGDAFNAGYLHARLARRSVKGSVTAGHRLAGYVIARRGGIPAISADAPYADLR
jgi:2-dehydro-3-deoxygluconokinase